MTTVVIRPPRDASGRTVVARRGLGLAGLVGLAALGSGCAGGEPAGTAGTSPPATPATTAAPAPTATPTDGCPVDAATLFAALKANGELYGAVDTEISGLRDLACLRGYATGTTIVPPERVDPAFVLFRYDRDSATWRALVAGTDAICTDLVPADVIPRLPGCLGS
ncbi:hypothetical protein C6361_22915 [Plantactinospora sp. BC1]|uniref:hypothetical protein n=1 Tax=Plantactinospora sp. BC1 TaxID=2108470 RepID=UPI000D17D6C0|nr:hypothetical protein [Plantactinospora sp. BC1]AVT31846.1 hypothetical protein C6361_22915 [Plantactinospora sp. BC1]